MESGTILLLLLIVIGLIIIVVCVVLIYIKRTHSTVIITPTCAQDVNISQLLSLTSLTSCPNSNQYYIGRVTNGKLDYTVAPYPSSPLDVCVAHCQHYSNGVCSGTPDAQSLFNSCMKELSPTNCYPPVPLAVKENILYYALSPGNAC
jgi:hypothetical protein